MERPGSHRVDSLTSRQREVLELIARGRTNSEIAAQLGITLDGAKWHVREILGKLDVTSREEAAQAWRERRQLPSPAWLGPVAWRIAGAAAAVAMTAVVIALILGVRDDNRGEAAPVSDFTTAPSPTPAGQLAFKDCARYENWSLPSTDNIRDRILLDERLLGSDGRPDPANHAYYLEYFWYNPAPSANSALIEPSVFHGVSTRDPDATFEDFCRYPDDMAYGFEHTQSLWLREHELVRLTGTSKELVATVRPEPGVFRIIQLDASITGTEQLKGVAATRPFRAVVIADEAGTELSHDNSTSRWEHDADGTFRVARVREPSFRVPVRSPIPVVIQVFGELPSGPITARVFDSPGNSTLMELTPGAGAWQPLAEIELEAGSWWFQFEGSVGPAGLILVRKGLPLP